MLKPLAVLMMLGLASASASSAATVRVVVEPQPNLTFSREVPSEVAITTPWGVEKASLKNGTLYAADPKNYFSQLDPVTVQIRIPMGTKAGRYPMSLKTSLYVCDQVVHLCSVRPAQLSGELTVGKRVGTEAAPLTLTLKIPKLRSF
jgi:hypothetical protein